MTEMQPQPCIDISFVAFDSVLKALTSFLNASNSLSFSDIKVLKFSLKEHTVSAKQIKNLLGAEMELVYELKS